MPGQVSSSNATASRGGDSKIVPQGQTSGDYSNDPYTETRQSRNNDPQALKP